MDALNSALATIANHPRFGDFVNENKKTREEQQRQRQQPTTMTKRPSESITPTHDKSKNECWIDWRKSAARARILKDLQEGKLTLEASELTPEQAWAHYSNEDGFQNVVFSQFKARLEGHRGQVKKKKMEKPKDPRKKGYIDWRSAEAAKAKNTIIEDLVQGILPMGDSEVPDEDVWTHYKNEEGFENIVFRQFKERLAAHRKQVQATLGRSLEEEEWLNHDRMIFPREEVNDDNIPYFDLHPAKELLKEDVERALHEKMTPEELRNSRDEYKVFPNSYFRPRIYQAVRKARFINYLVYAREVKNKLLRCKPRIDDKEKIESIRKELFAVRRKKQKTF